MNKPTKSTARQLKVKRLQDEAIIPTYGSDGAACFDLYSTQMVAIAPGRAGTAPTGISFEVPEGHVMLVFSRSGHGFKYGIRLANCTGVIDSDYRGEVMVRLQNDSNQTFTANAGERIAQAMVVPVDRYDFVEVSELSDTVRGEAGFGSSGK